MPNVLLGGCCLLALGLMILQFLAAWRTLRGLVDGELLSRAAWKGVLALIGLATAGLALETFEGPDRVHQYWGVQIALATLFVASGVAISAAWSARDATMRARIAPRAQVWIVLGALALFAASPILGQHFESGSWPPARAPGTQGARIADLVALGLGGDVPAWLSARTETDLARGFAHLAREVTVPLGTLLAGAWVIVVLCVLAIALRVLVAARGRALVAAIALPALGLLGAFMPAGLARPLGLIFDAGWFRPFDGMNSGVWDSDPDVLRGLAAVLVAALVAVALLGVVCALDVAFTRRAVRELPLPRTAREAA